MSRLIPTNRAALPRIPQEIESFLKDPPLWPGEDRAAYLKLLTAMAKSCGAGDDTLKWVLVDDVAHQVWEIRRFRIIEFRLVQKRTVEVIEEVFKDTYDPASGGASMVVLARDLAHSWADGGEAAKKVEERLEARGYDMESIRVRVYERCAAELRELETSIAKRESRRRAVLSDIERLNELFARRLAEASSEIIDAEFSEAAE